MAESKTHFGSRALQAWLPPNSRRFDSCEQRIVLLQQDINRIISSTDAGFRG